MRLRDFLSYNTIGIWKISFRGYLLAIIAAFLDERVPQLLCGQVAMIGSYLTVASNEQW